MARLILIYDAPNTHTFTGKPGQSLTLIPGKNDVDQDIFLALTEGKPGSQSLCQCIESGLVQVFKPKKDAKAKKEPVTDDEINISAMKVSDAVPLIENTFEVSELEAFKADELSERGRKTVLQAIEEQIESLTQADEGDE